MLYAIEKKDAERHNYNRVALAERCRRALYSNDGE